jgi:hypothetical protein
LYHAAEKFVNQVKKEQCFSAHFMATPSDTVAFQAFLRPDRGQNQLFPMNFPAFCKHS